MQNIYDPNFNKHVGAVFLQLIESKWNLLYFTASTTLIFKAFRQNSTLEKCKSKINKNWNFKDKDVLQQMVVLFQADTLFQIFSLCVATNQTTIRFKQRTKCCF